MYRRKKLIELVVGDRFRFPKRENINQVIRVYKHCGRPCVAYKSKERFQFITDDRIYKEVYVYD